MHMEMAKENGHLIGLHLKVIPKLLFSQFMETLSMEMQAVLMELVEITGIKQNSKLLE